MALLEGPALTATISLQRKVNLGNYESADVFMSVSGITQETTPEEVVALLDGPGSESYALLRERVHKRALALREGR